MTKLGLLATLATACTAPAPTGAPISALRGVTVMVAADRATPAVVERIATWVPPVPDCVGDAYGGLQVTADVAPDDGVETVLASFSQGVVVVAADGRRIAAAPGFDCAGSQDELVAIEVTRTPLDRPVIAVTASQGGRRERATWLALLAVGSSNQLDRLFLGEIELDDHRGSHAGDVTLVPGGLLHRHPTEGLSLWKYDAARRRYIAWRRIAAPASEPRPAPHVN